jgi:hypothetical protein
VSEESTLFRVVQQQMNQNSRIQTLESVESTFDMRTLAAFLQLPGLRGFWPMSSIGVAGQAIDLQGLGNHLTLNGNPLFNYSGLIPYCDYDGTGDFHSITDAASGNAFDILGNESYIDTGVQGLTVGGWFYFDRNTNAEALIAKADGVVNANRNYDLFYRGDAGGDPAQFNVANGAVAYTVTGITTIPTATWTFIAGRFIPSTSVDVFTNSIIATNAVAIPATINNSTADLNIAARNGGSLLDGRASMCFICTVSLGNVLLRSLYNQTRQLFQV